MSHTTENLHRPITIPTPGHAVKAKVVAAGVAIGDLADAAGIHNSTCTLYLQGKRRDPGTQYNIWSAFRRMTGSTITLHEFWGSLLSRR